MGRKIEESQNDIGNDYYFYLNFRCVRRYVPNKYNRKKEKKMFFFVIIFDFFKKNAEPLKNSHFAILLMDYGV